MSDKGTSVPQTQKNRQEEVAADEVVLRDESDEIIDTLKTQLRALQAQLDRYKAHEGGTLPPDADAGRTITAGALDLGLTPHIASRLEMPAGELTARLERLIAQVSEPEIKSELEQCRETAFFLFDTFRRIGEKHEQLTTSLTADTLVMGGEEFRGHLETSLHEHEVAVAVTLDAPLPGRLALAPQSVVTVLITLAELARDLFGQADRFTLGCPGLAETAQGEGGWLRLRITSERAWKGSGEGEAVSTAAIRSGIRSRAVVDLLYVEKIIEMRGGSLDFFREGARIHGFEVNLPVTLLEKE